jgi:hypothetical protein
MKARYNIHDSACSGRTLGESTSRSDLELHYLSLKSDPGLPLHYPITTCERCQRYSNSIVGLLVITQGTSFLSRSPNLKTIGYLKKEIKNEIKHSFADLKFDAKSLDLKSE